MVLQVDCMLQAWWYDKLSSLIPYSTDAVRVFAWQCLYEGSLFFICSAQLVLQVALFVDISIAWSAAVAVAAAAAMHVFSSLVVADVDAPLGSVVVEVVKE